MSKERTTIATKFGGIRPMARAGQKHGFNWPVSTVAYWNDNGFSSKRLSELIQVAKLEGVDLTLDDLAAA